jgi:hypothetical protein
MPMNAIQVLHANRRRMPAPDRRRRLLGLAGGKVGGDDRRPLTNSTDEMEEKPTAGSARHLTAERQRLARHRRARKLVCVTVELRHSEIQALICQGRLKGSECTDRGALRRALHSFFEVYLV